MRSSAALTNPANELTSTSGRCGAGRQPLLRRGEPTDAATQRRNVVRAMTSLAPLAARGPLVVTHGNGPQVGLLAFQAAAYECDANADGASAATARPGDASSSQNHCRSSS
jgi:hypothetical protein